MPTAGIDPQTALIYLMVIASAADADMRDEELRTIGETVRMLPVFQGFDVQRLTDVAGACTELLQDPDGLDRAFVEIRAALPTHLRETAYALACDVVVADGKTSQEELRLLEITRHRLDVDRLIAAAIERGARARHHPLSAPSSAPVLEA